MNFKKTKPPFSKKKKNYEFFELLDLLSVLLHDLSVFEEKSVDEDGLVKLKLRVFLFEALVLLVDDTLYHKLQTFGGLGDPGLLLGLSKRAVRRAVIVDNQLVGRLPTGVQVLVFEVEENGRKQRFALLR